MKIGPLSRCAGLVAACVSAAGFSATPASALTSKPGVDMFASGPADQSALLNGAGLKNNFGSNWPGLLPTWTANPTTDQRYVTSGTFQLTGDPGITYTATSDQAALNEFGSSPGGQDPTEDPVAGGQSPSLLDGFISTDEAPSNSQRAWAQIGGNDEASVPVAQAPIALIFSLPAGITFGSGNTLSLINNAPGDADSTVQAIFDGKVGPSDGYPANTWGALLTRAGLTAITGGPQPFGRFLDHGSASAHTGGYQPLELEVRRGDAPETAAVQDFLADSGDQNMTGATDAEQNWPSDANDGAGSNGYPAGPFGANVSGATEVENTLATPGTIGYVAAADAVFTVPDDIFYPAPQSTTYNGTAPHDFLFAAVQSDEGSTIRHYANPAQVQQNSSGSLEVVPNLYTEAVDSVTDGCQQPYSLTQVGRVGSLCETHDQYGLGWRDHSATRTSISTPEHQAYGARAPTRSSRRPTTASGRLMEPWGTSTALRQTQPRPATQPWTTSIGSRSPPAARPRFTARRSAGTSSPAASGQSRTASPAASLTPTSEGIPGWNPGSPMLPAAGVGWSQRRRKQVGPAAGCITVAPCR